MGDPSEPNSDHDCCGECITAQQAERRIDELERKLQERQEALEFQNRNVVKATENYDRLCKQLAAKEDQLKMARDCINAAPHSEHCAVVDWDEETGSHFEDEEEDCTCWKAEALKQMGVGE